MAKLSEAKLVEQIKTLKDIKPRNEWSVLLKSQILAEKGIEPITAKQSEARSVGIWGTISYVFFQKKIAYALATVILLVTGIFGFAEYTVPGDPLFPVKKIAEQSQAALSGQTGLKKSVAVLNSRINDLAQVTKEGKKDNIPSAINEINTNASELVESLKDNSADTATIQEIVISLKTLADVPGTDLIDTPEIKSLNDALAPYVENEISDIENTTLTEDQQNILNEVKDLYAEGKYVDALEKILLINKKAS